MQEKRYAWSIRSVAPQNVASFSSRSVNTPHGFLIFDLYSSRKISLPPTVSTQGIPLSNHLGIQPRSPRPACPSHGSWSTTTRSRKGYALLAPLNPMFRLVSSRLDHVGKPDLRLRPVVPPYRDRR